MGYVGCGRVFVRVLHSYGEFVVGVEVRSREYYVGRGVDVGRMAVGFEG